jgi:hypothetical protein
MSVTLGKLLVELLTNAGFDANDDALRDLVTSDIPVPDEASAALKNNLMTLETAKNNMELKKFYHAQALNAVDTELEDWISIYGDPSVKELIKGEKSSYKRMKLTLDKVRELESAKASGSKDPDLEKKLEKYREDIKGLNAQLAKLPQEHQTALESARTQAENQILQFALSAELGSKNYANADLPNIEIAQTLISKRLESIGAKLIRDGNNIKLVQSEDPSMAYIKDNKPLSFGSFADSVLGESKMLKVTNPDTGGGKNDFKHIPDGHKDQPRIPQEAASFYDEQLNAMAGQG